MTTRSRQLGWFPRWLLLTLGCLPLVAPWGCVAADPQEQARQQIQTLAAEGRLTVRALRAWGQLPVEMDELILSLREDGVNLLDADLPTLRRLLAERDGQPGGAQLAELTSQMAAFAAPDEADPPGLWELSAEPSPPSLAGDTLPLEPSPPPVIVQLLEDFEREHGERLAEDLQKRLNAPWALYRSSTLEQGEAILVAEGIPPRERLHELDLLLRSREGEWTLGAVGQYATAKALDTLKDEAISNAVALYAPHLGIPLKLILGANNLFSFLPGFSEGYGDDLVAYLEQEQNTARHQKTLEFLRECRTLTPEQIHQRIAQHQAQINANNQALTALPDQLRQQVMADLPSGIERLLPGLEREMLWLYVSGQTLPPSLRIQIENRLGNNPQWDRWLRGAQQQFRASWQETLRLTREQILLEQLNQTARLRLDGLNVCLGRTFQARSPADDPAPLAFGFLLMPPAEVVARASAIKGSPLDGEEAERMLADSHRQTLGDEGQLEAITLALPEDCLRQVQQQQLHVMLHGPYRTTRHGELVTDHEWERGYRVVATEYWDNGQKRSERRWNHPQQEMEELEWYDNGQPKLSRQWLDGKRQGVERRWRSDGAQESETHWRDDQQHGLQTRWGPNGQREQETHFQDGKRHGLEQKWHPNGTLAERSEYQQGRIVGLYTSWYANGQKREEGRYASDSQIAIQEGLWLRWDQAGECIEATEHFWDAAQGQRYNRRGRCP